MIEVAHHPAYRYEIAVAIRALRDVLDARPLYIIAPYIITLWPKPEYL